MTKIKKINKIKRLSADLETAQKEDLKNISKVEREISETRKIMYKPYLIPVSVKGIVFEIEDQKVWLRKNQRNEWELPGGKMDEGEQPEETVVRELKEELGFDVAVVDIIQAYLFKIKTSQDENKGVLVVSYLCRIVSKTGRFEINGEGGKAKFAKFSIEKVKKLNMPQFYKDAIQTAYDDFEHAF